MGEGGVWCCCWENCKRGVGYARRVRVRKRGDEVKATSTIGVLCASKARARDRGVALLLPHAVECRVCGERRTERG